MVRENLYEDLPPRAELPKKISGDPVLHYLEGWKLFGHLTIEGTEQDVLRGAAGRGAEAVDYEETTLGSGCEYGDVANVVVFLTSDRASSMTGQAIDIACGQEMR